MNYIQRMKKTKISFLSFCYCIKKFSTNITFVRAKDVSFTLLIWLLIGAPFASWAIQKSYFFSLSLMMACFAPAYILTFAEIGNNFIIKFFRQLVLLLSVLWCVSGCFCAIRLKCFLSVDILQILLQTNFNEMEEFITEYVGAADLFVFFAVLASLGGLYVCFKRRVAHSRYIAEFVLACFVFSTAMLYHHKNIMYGMLTNWNNGVDSMADLHYQQMNYVIKSTESYHPDKVIIIIGESYSKNHCQLYGYEKKTSPRLFERLLRDSLFVFTDVESPKPITIQVFKFILNSFTLNDEKDKKKWQYSINLIDVLNKCGYQSLWISNQAKEGLFDNMVGSNFKLCDSSYFTKGSNMYDESIFDIAVDHNNDKECVIYHLMGQHESFKNRYPSNFEIFHKEDYSSIPISQRKVLAEYDNATLYNDYVVDSIFTKYEHTNSIIFYFPDHGLDVFDSFADYYGHAQGSKESIKHCLQIPFMIYVSSAYSENNPGICAKIRARINEPFCTDHFFHLALELIGYSCN